MMLNLSFKPAQLTDAEAITNLVNAAYRGESSRQGWTTEADLLDGLRTTIEDIISILAEDDKLVLLAKMDEVLLGTVLLLRRDAQVELSMFAVDPRYQDQGIGKQLLTYAEDTAILHWEVKQAMMAVIPCRTELMAFYQRRGYRLTGEKMPFPVNPALWTPKVDTLSLTLLVKELSAKGL
jgi:ribosomal protein S18 acetylase RimI-like enzyme